MRSKVFMVALLVVLCLVLTGAALAQQPTNPATGKSTTAPPTEKTVGGYLTSGVVEAGYRFTDVTGDHYPCATGICTYAGAYDTFENLQQGFRVFSGQFTLRAPGGQGVLFDQLSFSSFGWGGDPQTVARLSVSKRKIYNFAATWRRNKNAWDYNLLANPLNPWVPGSPFFNARNIPVLTSPHFNETTHRLGDISLTLFPSSPISVRLGYDQNNMYGPSGWTIHLPRGQDINPLMNQQVTTNGYRAGIDLKFIPRTTFSFDAVYRRFKNDPFTTDSFNLTSVVTGTTVPLDPGISSWFNTTGLTGLNPYPCAVTAFLGPTCNAALFFQRWERTRTTMPTFQGAFQSQYFKRLDLSGRFVYGWADNSDIFFQQWQGFTSTTIAAVNDRRTRNNRITNEGDFGITIELTDHIRLSDTFRYNNAKIASTGGVLDQVWNCPSPSCTAGGVNILTPLTSPLITLTATPSFVDNGLFQRTTQNQAELGIDLGKWVGVHVGYRYTKRRIVQKGQGFDADIAAGDERGFLPEGEPEGGDNRWDIPSHTALAGFWIQPSSKFRLNADFEGTSSGIKYTTNDNTAVAFYPAVFTTGVTGFTTFTRLTPRKDWQSRVRATIKPMRNVTLGFTVNDLEQKNNLTAIKYNFHNRNAGFNIDVSPNEKVSFDLAYNWQGVVQDDLACYYATPNLLGNSACALQGVNSAFFAANYFQSFVIYHTTTNFGAATIRLRPVKRATLVLGYSLVSNNGSYFSPNPQNPSGPLRFNYHRPLADVSIDMYKGLALIGGFNYYDYNEKGTQGPTLRRDFHANVGSVGLRYAF